MSVGLGLGMSIGLGEGMDWGKGMATGPGMGQEMGPGTVMAMRTGVRRGMDTGMDSFLAAQVDDPFDPAPMLIQADWLEEQGDVTGANVFRALAESGTPSLHALALEATLRSVPWQPDVFRHRRWSEDGYGHGTSDWIEDGDGRDGQGFGRSDGHKDHAGHGFGYADGIAGGYMAGDGVGGLDAADGVGVGDDIDE